MEFAALKWWHWILIALAVGVAVGALRDSTQSEIHGNYIEGFGYFLGSQKLFEEALIDKADGKRRFSDVTVYVRQIDDGTGQRKQVYLVKGTYFAKSAGAAEGQKPPGWQPACFIAPVPYDPMIDFETLNKPGGPDWGKTFRAAGLHPTVLDFLSVMHSAAGVDYRFAWWDQYPMLTSVLASVLVIGICWPPLINLLSFRRITRPPEAKGISLWKVRNRKRTTKDSAQISNSYESDDTLATPAEPPGPESESASPSSPAQLATSPVELLEPSDEATKEFGAGKEDFYPTERHTPAKPEKPD